MTGGQVVAGSNPVSPTSKYAGQKRFSRNREPLFCAHLSLCQQRPGIFASFRAVKPALTCVFCPQRGPRMTARSSARVVTRKSDDGGRAFHPAPKIAVELEFFLCSARRSMMPAAPVIVTRMSQLALGSAIGAVSADR